MWRLLLKVVANSFDFSMSIVAYGVEGFSEGIWAWMLFIHDFFSVYSEWLAFWVLCQFFFILFYSYSLNLVSWSVLQCLHTHVKDVRRFRQVNIINTSRCIWTSCLKGHLNQIQWFSFRIFQAMVDSFSKLVDSLIYWSTHLVMESTH